MKKYTLKAEARKISGKKVKALRKKGTLPANLFGKKVKSQSIEVDANDFLKLFDEAGETSVIELSVGKEVKPVLVSNLQVHPVTEELLHVDFRQIDLKEKVTATVPVELVGEAPAEKSGLGTLVQHIDELEVEALPNDLPEKFEAGVEALSEVDSAITVNDLKYDKAKVEIKAEPEAIVAKIEPLAEEEELPAPEETVAEEGAETKEETSGEEKKEASGPEGAEAPSES